eukprot:jgi/Psemu1/35536/gm1.35536_g
MPVDTQLRGRFVGHNQTDLKGILIPEDANAKHYNELKERLETLGGSKCIPQVGSSIEHLVQFEHEDFAPTKPTAKEYSTIVVDPVTQAAQTVKILGLKETLMDMYKEELKKKADEWIQYQCDMEKVYRLTLEQINDRMKAKQKGLKAWKAIDSSKCVVELLKAVRDLCFQSSQIKVHPVTIVLRAIHKLLCTQQRSLDMALYVKMMTEQNLDVVKSLGGTLVCKATISYELETNPLYAAYDYSAYLTLTRAAKTAIGHTVEQQAITALIAEGLDTDKSQHKPGETTGMETTHLAKATTMEYNATGRRANRIIKDPTCSPSREAKQLTYQQTNTQTTYYMFLHIGMLSEWDNESNTTSSSSTVSSTTSTYRSNSSDNSDGVPDLVPRTDQYSDSEPDNTSTSSGDTKEDFHFSHNVEHLFIQSKSEGGVNSYWILLGSESSLNLIVDPELVTNIQQAPNSGFMSIQCNSGVSKTNLIADLPGFGMDGGTRRFQRSGCNQYYCDMQEYNGTVLALDMVEGKANSYSALDCFWAKKARDMQEILGFPTSKELIKMIDNNILKDCPITRRDIKVVPDIYGKHVSILKGKSVRQQVPHTRENITPIPSNILKAYRDVTLCVNIITVNSIQFLVSILGHIQF